MQIKHLTGLVLTEPKAIAMLTEHYGFQVSDKYPRYLMRNWCPNYNKDYVRAYLEFYDANPGIVAFTVKLIGRTKYRSANFLVQPVPYLIHTTTELTIVMNTVLAHASACLKMGLCWEEYTENPYDEVSEICGDVFKTRGFLYDYQGISAKPDYVPDKAQN